MCMEVKVLSVEKEGVARNKIGKRDSSLSTLSPNVIVSGVKVSKEVIKLK